MRKVDDGEKKKNVVFSGNYFIASSPPPEHQLLEHRTLEPKEFKEQHLQQTGMVVISDAV